MHGRGIPDLFGAQEDLLPQLDRLPDRDAMAFKYDASSGGRREAPPPDKCGRTRDALMRMFGGLAAHRRHKVKSATRGR